MKRVIERAVSLFLALIVVLGVAPLSGFIGVKDIFTTTAEAASNGYTVIWSPNDLNNIRKNLSGSYILANDIDMSKFGNWQPIGTTSAPFTGKINGNGHSIKNLTVELTSNTPNGEDTINAGFIGTSNGAHISNLGVEDSYISHTQTGSTSDTASFCNASGIVGVANNSTIEKCFFTGEVRSVATKYAFARSCGVALCTNSTIRNCYVNADIYSKGYSANTMVGGIAAWNEGSTVDKCYAAGTIYAESTKAYVYLGGIVGSGNGTVSNSVVLFDSVKYSGATTIYGTTLLDAVCPFSTLKNNKALSSVISSVPNKSAKSISVSNAKSSSTYTAIGWDFDSVWKIDGDYPTLITNEGEYGENYNSIKKLFNEYTFDIPVKAIESGTDKHIPVKGANVTIYIGSVAIAEEETDSTGIAHFTKDSFKNHIYDMGYILSNATVSAHLQVVNRDVSDIENEILKGVIDLCSEDVLSDGTWAGEEFSNIINNANGYYLLVDEPRMYIDYNISLYFQKYDQNTVDKITSEINQFKDDIAQMTNGHVLLSGYDITTYTDMQQFLSSNADVFVSSIPFTIKNRYVDWPAANPYGYYLDGSCVVFLTSQFESNTLCHESGHYLFGCYDEYCYGLGCDYNGVADAGYWSTHGDGSDLHCGQISRPEGAPPMFGVMEDGDITIELSNEWSYSYLDSIENPQAVHYTNHYEKCKNSTYEQMLATFDRIIKSNNINITTNPQTHSVNPNLQSVEYWYAAPRNSSKASDETDYSDLCNYDIFVNSLCTDESIADVTFSKQDSVITIESDNTDIFVFWESLQRGDVIELEPTANADRNIYSFSYEENDSATITIIKKVDELYLKNEHFVYPLAINDGEETGNSNVTLNSISGDDYSGVLIFSEYDILNADYESVCCYTLIIDSEEDVEGKIGASLNSVTDFDFSSFSWFKSVNGNWVAQETISSKREHEIITFSCDYAGNGTYVLMAKASADTVYNAPTGVTISTEECIYEDQIKISFNDSNENIYGYNVYYCRTKFDSIDNKNMQIESVFSETSNVIINLNERNETFYFAVEAVGFDGGKSPLSEVVSYEVNPKDDNGDGLPNYWLKIYPSLVELDEDVGETDSDDDGLTNLQEYELGTNPLLPDTDGDNVYDIIEIRNDINPLEPMTDGETDDYTVIYGSPDVFIDEASFIVDETTVTCTISNNTDGRAMRTHIYLYDSDGELLELNEVNLDANSSVDYSFSKEYFVNGMRIVIDEEKITRDSDYTNNEFVYVPATGISANTSEITVVKGKTTQLEYTLTPEDASKIVEWRSSDETVVTVSKHGLVTGVKIGTATITATTLTGCSCSYDVLVEPFPGAGQTDFDCVLINDDTELRIIGYVGSETSIYIPEQIAGYSVTSVANGAFVNESIESIYIPATVSEIQTQAFKCVSNFKSISVDSANNNYCSADGVLFNYDQTEIVAYPPAKEDVEYKIPDTVLTVKPYAFYKAQNLKTVDLNNVQAIQEYGFDYSALTSVTIPEQVTTLGKSAFYNCENLTDVYFNAVDCDCSFSPNIFSFAVTTKIYHVFSETVTSVTFGETVQNIDNGIFGLVSVAELNIPESVKRLELYLSGVQRI